MGDENTTRWHFNLKLTTAEHERVEKLKDAIQQRLGPNVAVSQRTVFLEALEKLEAYYARLERDKTRER